jgi:hypothetical protein
MQADQLRQRLYQEPFQPFRVRLKDGRHYDITYPYMHLVGESVFIIGIAAPDNPDPRFYDYTEWVNLSLIDGLENLPEATTPAAL